MLPHEHFFIAILPVVLAFLLRYRRLPPKAVVGAVAVGSLFPDLVDKPLAHYFHVLPSGRVFLHSLPFAIPLAIVALAYGWQTDRLRIAGAFTVGFADPTAEKAAHQYPAVVALESRGGWTVGCCTLGSCAGRFK